MKKNNFVSLIAVGFLTLSLVAIVVTVSDPLKKQFTKSSASSGNSCFDKCRKEKGRVYCNNQCGTSVAPPSGKSVTNSEIAPQNSKTACDNAKNAWCAGCGGFCITAQTKTCNQMQLERCGQAASTIGGCTPELANQCVVYSSGANDYRKCVKGKWVKDSSCNLATLTPGLVPVYLQTDYDNAVSKAKSDCEAKGGTHDPNLNLCVTITTTTVRNPKDPDAPARVHTTTVTTDEINKVTISSVTTEYTTQTISTFATNSDGTVVTNPDGSRTRTDTTYSTNLTTGEVTTTTQAVVVDAETIAAVNLAYTNQALSNFANSPGGYVFTSDEFVAVQQLCFQQYSAVTGECSDLYSFSSNYLNSIAQAQFEAELNTILQDNPELSPLAYDPFAPLGSTGNPYSNVLSPEFSSTLVADPYLDIVLFPSVKYATCEQYKGVEKADCNQDMYGLENNPVSEFFGFDTYINDYRNAVYSSNGYWDAFFSPAITSTFQPGVMIGALVTGGVALAQVPLVASTTWVTTGAIIPTVANTAGQIFTAFNLYQFASGINRTVDICEVYPGSSDCLFSGAITALSLINAGTSVYLTGTALDILVYKELAPSFIQYGVESVVVYNGLANLSQNVASAVRTNIAVGAANTLISGANAAQICYAQGTSNDCISASILTGITGLFTGISAYTYNPGLALKSGVVDDIASSTPLLTSGAGGNLANSSTIPPISAAALAAVRIPLSVPISAPIAPIINIVPTITLSLPVYNPISITTTTSGSTILYSPVLPNTNSPSNQVAFQTVGNSTQIVNTGNSQVVIIRRSDTIFVRPIASVVILPNDIIQIGSGGPIVFNGTNPSNNSPILSRSLTQEIQITQENIAPGLSLGKTPDETIVIVTDTQAFVPAEGLSIPTQNGSNYIVHTQANGEISLTDATGAKIVLVDGTPTSPITRVSNFISESFQSLILNPNGTLFPWIPPSWNRFELATSPFNLIGSEIGIYATSNIIPRGRATVDVALHFNEINDFDAVRNSLIVSGYPASAITDDLLVAIHNQAKLLSVPINWVERFVVDDRGWLPWSRYSTTPQNEENLISNLILDLKKIKNGKLTITNTRPDGSFFNQAMDLKELDIDYLVETLEAIDLQKLIKSGGNVEDIIDILLYNSLDKIVLPTDFPGRKSYSDWTNVRYFYLNSYLKDPNFTRFLVKTNITGAHGSTSSSLIDTTNFGLLSQDQMSKKGLVIASGEGVFGSSNTNKTRISLAQINDLSTAVGYSNQKPNLPDDIIQQIANIEKTLSAYPDNISKDSLLIKRQNLQNTLEYLDSPSSTDLEKLKKVLIQQNFPIVYLVKGGSNGYIYGGLHTEYVVDDQILRNDIKAILTTSEEIEFVKKMVKYLDWNVDVFPIESTQGFKPSAVKHTSSDNLLRQEELLNNLLNLNPSQPITKTPLIIVLEKYPILNIFIDKKGILLPWLPAGVRNWVGRFVVDDRGWLPWLRISTTPENADLRLQNLGLDTNDFLPISNFYKNLTPDEIALITKQQTAETQIYILPEDKFKLTTPLDKKVTGHRDSSNKMAIGNFPKKGDITFNLNILENTSNRPVFSLLLVHEFTHINGPQLLSNRYNLLTRAINENIANDMAYIYAVENRVPSDVISRFYNATHPDYVYLMDVIKNQISFREALGYFADKYIPNGIRNRVAGFDIVNMGPVLRTVGFVATGVLIAIGLGLATIAYFFSQFGNTPPPVPQSIINPPAIVQTQQAVQTQVALTEQAKSPLELWLEKILGFKVFMQRSLGNIFINPFGGTNVTAGCGPSTAYNILTLSGYNIPINTVLDTYYWSSALSAPDAVLLSLERNGYPSNTVEYGTQNRMTDTTQLTNYTGILVYGGTVSSPTESIAHIATFDCFEGTCVVIDSYFGDGAPTTCITEVDGLKCGDYSYPVGTVPGKSPNALFPVVGTNQ